MSTNKEALRQIRASLRAEKKRARSQARDAFLDRASKQTQKMATFKITPLALRDRLLNPHDPLCPLHGFVGGEEAMETALAFGRMAFESLVDIGLAAGKWHEAIWACTRACPARMLLTGPASVTADFARRFAALVSMNWDDFSIADNPAYVPGPTDTHWKLPWLERSGDCLKRRDDIMTALTQACRAKGLPLLPVGRAAGARQYRVPPMVVLVSEVQFIPNPLIKAVRGIADDGSLDIGVNARIDFRSATIIATFSQPDQLDETFLSCFPERLDVC